MSMCPTSGHSTLGLDRPPQRQHAIWSRRGCQLKSSFHRHDSVISVRIGQPSNEVVNPGRGVNIFTESLV